MKLSEDQEQIRFNKYYDAFRIEFKDNVAEGIEFLISFLCTVVVMTADDPDFSLNECSTLILQAKHRLNLKPKDTGFVQ